MSVNNIQKLIQHLEPLCKGKLVADGVEYDRPKRWLKLSPTFFCRDGCVGCGKCCFRVAESVILTKWEYDNLFNYSPDDFQDYGLDPKNLADFKEGLVPDVHVINGKEVTVYKDKIKKKKFHLDETGKTIDACHHMFKREDGNYRCGIHPVRSITCRMPHVRVFYTNHGCVSIGVSQYGRNWAIGCGVLFSDPNTEEEFNQIKKERIELLRYLLHVAIDLNCDTYLPELIEYAEQCTFDNYHLRINLDLLPSIQSKKLFTVGDLK